MQFMSLALGWEDCVVLAMAPLGIITILVSAIRVGGPAWLKAIIGRARENVSAAEMELMSSTSKEVCELYNGQTIVRCPGSSPVWEFIYLIPITSRKQDSDGRLDIRVVTLEEACQEDRKLLHKLDIFTSSSSPKSSDISVEQGVELGTFTEHAENSDQSPNEAIYVVRNMSPDAPNIILNLQDNNSNRKELQASAVIGVTLQLCVLVFFGIITYHPAVKNSFRKDDRHVEDYAFPLAAGGTLVLVLGIFLCGTVVESSTRETHYKRNDKYEMRVVWIQQKQTVGDRVFEPFATFPGSPRDMVSMSHRCDASHAQTLGPLTVVGIFIGLTGFFIQFIGLRAMNSAATLAQLGAIGIMTAIRAWVRRGLARPPQEEKLTSGFELDTLAWALTLLNHSQHEKPKPGLAAPMANLEQNPASSNNVWQGHFRQQTKRGPQQLIRPGDIGQLMNLEKQQQYSWTISTGGSIDHQPLLQHASSPNSKAQQVFETRRNLGRLAQSKGASANEAINLSKAMEKVMNVLFPFGSNEVDRVWTWPLPVSYSDSLTENCPCYVYLSLICKEGSWKVLADQLGSVLSLFMFTAHKQEESQSRGGQAEFNLDDENNDWLRQKTMNSGLGIRLFGPADVKQADQLIQDLRWWAPESFDTLAEIQEVERLQGDSGTKEKECVCKEPFAKSADREYEFDEIFRSDPRLDAIRVDDDRAVGYGPPCPQSRRNGERQRYFRNFSTFCHCFWSKMERGTLAMESNDSLEKLYAKDLLFSFLLSAAKTIPKRLNCEVTTRGTAVSKRVNDTSTVLVTTEMSSLAAEFIRLGYGDEQEAWVSIIAPLSMMEKLPFPQTLFDLARERSEAMRREHDWAGASGEYAKLWTQTQRYADTSIHGRSTAMMVEHLGDLRSERKEGSFGDAGLDFSMKTSETQLFGILCYPVRGLGVFDPLLKLYEKQNRPAMSEFIKKLAPSRPLVDEFPDYLGITKLHRMAMESDEGDVVGVDQDEVQDAVNGRDICDWTPLHYATVRGSYKFVKSLLEKDADPNLKDLLGYTPVHYACQLGNWDLLRSLESKGGKMDINGVGGVTPMHLAARSGNVKLIRSWRSEAGRDHRSEWNDRSEWRHWIEPPIKLRDCNGRMPVHWAVIHGQKGVVRELKSTLDEPDAYGWTSLHLAALYHKESSDLLRTVFNMSAEKDKKDRQGCTALILAFYRNKWDAARELIEAGADVTTRTPDGTTALYYPLWLGNTDLIQDLVDRGAEINISMQKLDGLTPLHWTAKQGNSNIMATLLGALDRPGPADRPLTIDCSLGDGQTPLHVAISHKRLEIMRLLLSKGADANRADRGNHTPLHYALTLDADELGEDELGEGEMSERELGGYEPDEGELDEDEQHEDKQVPLVNEDEQTLRLHMVKLLLDNGADPWARDPQGRTPLEIARKRGLTSAVTYLRNCEFLSRVGMPIAAMTVREGIARAASEVDGLGDLLDAYLRLESGERG
ncbi:hypothetical protein ACHAPT_004356 [Fusarium lateritium]